MQSSSEISERLSPSARLRNPRSLWKGSQQSTEYPSWLFGEWEVRSRPTSFTEPLGAAFVDEETRAAIKEDFSEAGKAKELTWRSRFYWAVLDRIGKPIPRRGRAVAPGPAGVRLVSTSTNTASTPECQDRVVQFRSFNAAQEVRAFLGQPEVVADADPTKQPLQISVSFPVREEDEELVRTVTLKLEACRTEVEDGSSTCTSSELFRQVVSTEGEVDSVGDFEVINAYTLLDRSAGIVSVQNRVAKYLVPTDPLFEEAGGAAVSWLDYTWKMRRLQTCISTPYGEQCYREDNCYM